MERSKAFKTVCTVIEILICFVLQQTPYLFPEIFGSTPALIISAGLTISVFESPERAVIIGAVCGCLADIGAGSLIGPVGIITALFCLLISYVFNKIISENILFSFALCAIGVFICISGIFIFNYLVYDYPGAADIFVSRFLPSMLYTFIACVILYFINKLLFKAPITR